MHVRVGEAVAVFLVVSFIASGSTVFASEPAHEHGVGRLDIAFEGDEVELELTVPGADAVGFEHAPSTDADRHAVEDANKKLANGPQLFLFPSAAKCRFEEAEVHAAQLDDDHDDHGEKHEHEKHDEKDEHAHDHEEGKDGEHAEFRAHYHVHCDAPSKLTQIDVAFFSLFPSAHELEVRWITPRGQGSAELTAKASRIRF